MWRLLLSSSPEHQWLMVLLLALWVAIRCLTPSSFTPTRPRTSKLFRSSWKKLTGEVERKATEAKMKDAEEAKDEEKKQKRSACKKRSAAEDEADKKNKNKKSQWNAQGHTGSSASVLTLPMESMP
ncbi:hypothetical protein F511_27041 [Dorcoceras hygrometricum]|uniref:Secreted protein n=1 Tax=Dorcoceras hygrometricum TaxID=472368 RepID=A0A2Z7BCK7_9LAMI|nr:hypothetical protein F511_27041 [Dorcoceras hygrometricum]